jgi:hypothetical protein
VGSRWEGREIRPEKQGKKRQEGKKKIHDNIQKY